MSQSNKNKNKKRHRNRLAVEKFFLKTTFNSSPSTLVESSEGNNRMKESHQSFLGVAEPHSDCKEAVVKPKLSPFPTSSLNPVGELESASVFGSRKRKLARITFVRPNVNGIAELFSFGKVKDANHAKKKEALDNDIPLILQASNQSHPKQNIDEILYPQSLHESPITFESFKEIAKSEDNERTKIVGKTIAKPKDGRSLETAVNTDSSEKSFALLWNRHGEKPLTFFDEKEEATHHHGQISGVSVEDAVRDSVGLRPRSNSTDGELKLPQRGLCDERKVLEAYRWNFDIQSRPKGFRNLGNTCYLNSTLQCLAYLPPFCQSLMELQEVRLVSKKENGSKEKLINGKRITHILRSLFRRVHGDKNCSAISPNTLVDAVPTLGASGSRTGYKFRPGRQEDAHEFLVHLLDAMHDGELQDAGINPHRSGWRDRLPVPRLNETTFIHRIFGGYLRSQVSCTSCGYCSNTYDPFLDLSLEISSKTCTSLTDAMQQFTRKETLDSENRWKCSGCKKRVCASKQLTVFRPPLSLCIQLKRFSFRGKYLIGGNYHFFGNGGGGTKITKPIEFPSCLKLPLSDGRSCGYSLCGVVIHVGGSASSGHYTACVKRAGKKESCQWFHMDDSDANPVSEKAVLRQKDAYLLFYSREEVKLEFPPPPRRTSMSAEEAQELSRARARAKSLMPVEEEKGQQAFRTEQVGSSDPEDSALMKREKQVNKNFPFGGDHKPRPKSSSNLTQFPDADQNMESKSSRFRYAAPNSQSAQSNTLEDGSHNTSSVIKLNTLDLGTSIIRESEALAHGTGALFIANSCVSSVDALPISHEKSDAKPRIKLKQSTTTDTTDLHHNSSKHGIKETQADGEDIIINKKEKARLSLERDGGKIEVMMGPRFKSQSSAWNPNSCLVSRHHSFGLLGNHPVTKWDDDSEDGSAKHKLYHSKHKQYDRTQEDRSKLLDELEKKENTTKRRMNPDRWDSILDQGKTKKIRKNDDGKAARSNFGQNNAFQRIQSSLQKMNRGKQNSHFQSRKIQKRRK